MTKEEIKQNVEMALTEIRPYLIADGGNISLVEINNDIVKVKLHGTCINCAVNQMTLKNGVEEVIKKYVPKINKVIEVKN